jgi:glyoxylate/hydroxypyruvate reductase A
VSGDPDDVTTVVPYIRDGEPNEPMLAGLRRSLPDVLVAPVTELDPDQLATARVAVLDGVDVDQLASMTSLEMVQATWAGVESVLAVVPDDVHVLRMIDPQLGLTMAEAVLTWVLYLHRGMPAYLRQQRAAEWIEHAQVLASDRRVGILGLGALGGLAATTLRDQGFEVAGWSRSARAIEGVDCFHGAGGFGELLERSDIVVNLLPHTAATSNLLDAAAFARLPDGASVINVGRGATIDDDALLAALDDRLDHAVLDVFTEEPLPGDHPYWAHPQVTVLPHVAANTTPDTASVIAAANIAAFLADGSLPDDSLVDRSLGY